MRRFKPPWETSGRCTVEPAQSEVHARVGNCFADVDKKGAVEVLRDAVQHSANNADAHYNLGLALATNGEKTDGRGARVPLRAGTDAEARVSIARAWSDAHAPGQRRLGVALRRAAVEAAPNDAEAANNLGAVQIRLRDIRGAVETLQARHSVES